MAAELEVYPGILCFFQVGRLMVQQQGEPFQRISKVTEGRPVGIAAVVPADDIYPLEMCHRVL